MSWYYSGTNNSHFDLEYFLKIDGDNFQSNSEKISQIQPEAVETKSEIKSSNLEKSEKKNKKRKIPTEKESKTNKRKNKAKITKKNFI